MLEYMKLRLQGFSGDKRAVTALEYAMIAGVLVVVLVAAFTTLGTDVSNALSNIGAKL